MGQRAYVPILGSVSRGMVFLAGRFLLGSSGAIGATVDSAKHCGFTLTKTATKTGRYTVALDKNYNRVIWADAKVWGADDAAYTTAKGLDVLLRDDDVGQGAADGTFEIQFVRSDTGADAEVEDARTLSIMIVVRDANLNGT